MIHIDCRRIFLGLLDDLNISVTESITFYLTPTASVTFNYFRIFKEKINCLRNVFLKFSLKQSISSVWSRDSWFVPCHSWSMCSCRFPAPDQLSQLPAGGGRQDSVPRSW